MVGRLQGKTAIVFGAGSRGAGWGNGKAAAVLFAREGAKIFAVDINPEALEETQKIIQEEGGNVSCAVADVTDSESINIAVNKCVKCFGGIDILHNNVGAPAPGDPVAMSVDTWHKNMAINIDSAFITCKHVLPVMADGGGGAVVNIASIAGIKNLERSLVGYQAGKAAMIQLSRSVAAQWAPKGIRSNCILPGLMATPLVLDRVNKTYNTPKARQAALDERHRMIPMGYMGDAWDTAWAAVYLASEEAKYVTATELIVDGGITAGRPLDWRSGSSGDVMRVPDAGARSYPTADPRLEKKVALVVALVEFRFDKYSSRKRLVALAVVRVLRNPGNLILFFRAQKSWCEVERANQPLSENADAKESQAQGGRINQAIFFVVVFFFFLQCIFFFVILF